MVEEEIKKITREEAHGIIEVRRPFGLFLLKTDKKYIAIDNKNGHAWVEEFKTEKEAIKYLKDEDD